MMCLCLSVSVCLCVCVCGRRRMRGAVCGSAVCLCVPWDACICGHAGRGGIWVVACMCIRRESGPGCCLCRRRVSVCVAVGPVCVSRRALVALCALRWRAEVG